MDMSKWLLRAESHAALSTTGFKARKCWESGTTSTALTLKDTGAAQCTSQIGATDRPDGQPSPKHVILVI